jgi:hypothetical protein
MGAIFVLVVLFLPKGLAGFFELVWDQIAKRRGRSSRRSPQIRPSWTMSQGREGTTMANHLELSDVVMSFNGFRASTGSIWSSVKANCAV